MFDGISALQASPNHHEILTGTPQALWTSREGAHEVTSSHARLPDRGIQAPEGTHRSRRVTYVSRTGVSKHRGDPPPARPPRPSHLTPDSPASTQWAPQPEACRWPTLSRAPQASRRWPRSQTTAEPSPDPWIFCPPVACGLHGPNGDRFHGTPSTSPSSRGPAQARAVETPLTSVAMQKLTLWRRPCPPSTSTRPPLHGPILAQRRKRNTTHLPLMTPPKLHGSAHEETAEGSGKPIEGTGAPPPQQDKAAPYQDTVHWITWHRAGGHRAGPGSSPAAWPSRRSDPPPRRTTAGRATCTRSGNTGTAAGRPRTSSPRPPCRRRGDFRHGNGRKA